MSDNNDRNKNTSAKWAFGGTVIAALITGLVTLIVAGKIPFPTDSPPATPFSVTESTQNPIDTISGTWVGTAKSGDFEFDIKFTIGESCNISSTCGTFDFPSISCSGTLKITNIDGNLFEFQANEKTSGCLVAPEVDDSLQLLPDGTLLFVSKSSIHETRGILSKKK